MAAVITKLLCIYFGAGFGLLVGIGIGSDVRRWLRRRET